MNEELMKILEKSYEFAIKTGEFVVEEGGILIQEFLNWKLLENGFFALVGIFLIIGVPLINRGLFDIPEEGEYIGHKFFGKVTKYDTYDNELVISYIISGASFMCGIFTFIACSLAVIKILVAPNVYLLEYILQNL